MTDYIVKCECGQTGLKLSGRPRVSGTCHCGDCRELLNIPYHMVNAWLPEQVEILDSEGALKHYPHPKLTMSRVCCSSCGEVLYNTNSAGWYVVSQLLVAKNYDTIPEDLQSKSHFFYDRRIVNIEDELPKR